MLSLAPYSFLWFQLQGSIPADEADHGDRAPVIAQTLSGEEEQLEVSSLESSTLPRTGKSAAVEVHDVAGDGGLLVHTAPATFDALRKTVLGVAQTWTGSGSNPRIVLTFPVAAGESEWSAKGAELNRLAPQFQLAPYTPGTASIPQMWPYAADTYVELARLAEQHNANTVIQLGPESDTLPWPCILALARPVLGDGMGFSVARYQLNRYTGLLNSAALRPLTRAIFGADLCYPLAPDAAYSRTFLQRLVSSVPVGGAGSREALILWPALEAVTQSVRIAQVDVGARHFVQPLNPDVTALLAQILSSLFAEIRQSASYWQRSRPLYPVRNPTVCDGAGPTPDQRRGKPAERDPAAARPVDVSSMLASFQLGVGNLQEVWSQVLAPGTLLGIKRLSELPPAEFKMSDALWVRIVWDFLAAYRSRSVNRNHIFGALVPLYLGWAASYVTQVATLSDAAVEQRIAALAVAFEADKPYLMARWRWPDRFTP